jgi:hypothetical protein
VDGIEPALSEERLTILLDRPLVVVAVVKPDLVHRECIMNKLVGNATGGRRIHDDLHGIAALAGGRRKR